MRAAGLLLAALLSAACGESHFSQPSNELHLVAQNEGDEWRLRVLHDDARHVTCWQGTWSMVCMRDADLHGDGGGR